jgi:predicted metalloprotease
MKRVLIALVGMAAAAALLPSGTAHAYPVTNKKLTANEIYESGELDITECPEQPVKRRNAKLATAYVQAVLSCLNTTWAAQLEKSGQSFSPARLKVTTKPPAKYCGVKWDDIDSLYCSKTKTIYLVLGKNLLADPSDLYLFNLVSQDYGEHVQTLTGIHGAYVDLRYRNKKEYYEQERRYNLQGLCLGTAFLASVWDSLDRTSGDRNELLSYMKGWSGKYQGTKTNIAYWMNQGFKAGDPSACNTWTEPASRVA